MTIAYQIQKVSHRIDQAINQYSVIAHPVTLLAVSKTHKSSKIRDAFQAGQKDFGESYVQESVSKISELKDCDICWHFIGPIQSNKTARIAENFDWVHSVDRLKIARRLAEQRPEDLKPLNICLQVNISAEKSKGGILIDQLPELMNEVCKLENITVRGLMCIPAKAEGFENQRLAFHQMRLLFIELQQKFTQLDTLSMGMSSDFEAAIAEGSTMVRVGTEIFGLRNKPTE